MVDIEVTTVGVPSFDVNYKKGEFVEIVDEDLDETYEDNLKKVMKKIKEIIKENPDISLSELNKIYKEQLKRMVWNIDDIKDRLENRKWGKVTKIKKTKDGYSIEVKFIKKNEYNELIDKISKNIAKQITQEDVENLIKDAIADAGIEPNKLKKIAKKKDFKVETKTGCFNIILDDDIQIPIRR